MIRVHDSRVIDGKDKGDDSEVNSGWTRQKKKLGNDCRAASRSHQSAMPQGQPMVSKAERQLGECNGVVGDSNDECGRSEFVPKADWLRRLIQRLVTNRRWAGYRRVQLALAVTRVMTVPVIGAQIGQNSP